jgi:hypothetical protein
VGADGDVTDEDAASEMSAGRSSAGVEDREASQKRDGIEFVAIFRGANVFAVKRSA